MFKKILFFAAILMVFGMAGYGQSLTMSSWWIGTDSCWTFVYNHHVATYGSVANATANTGVTLYWGDGTSSSGIVTLSGSNANFWADHNYAAAGTFTVKAVVDNGTSAVDSGMKTMDNFCKIVAGGAYLRTDNNCFWNPSTEPVMNVPLHVEVRKAGVPVDTIVANNGFFYDLIDSADYTSVYSLHLLDTPAGVTLVCPASDYTFKFDTLNYYYNGGDQFKYAFECDPNSTGYDLSVTAFGKFKANASSYLNIYPKNISCNGQNAVVTLNLSPKYTANTVSPTPTSVSGNTYTWNINNLSNTSGYNFISLVLSSAAPTLAVGDTVHNYLSITPTSSDWDTANNTFAMMDSVKASWDPNAKIVYPAGNIVAGQTLTYTIQFENTGNDTAYNIHLLDTLSENLDASSFQIVTSSHPVTYQMVKNGNQKVLRFDFANIKLPDASDPDHNKGFVTYQIKALDNLSIGTVINNTADIYFDANPAVTTNTTHNIIPDGLGVKETKVKATLEIFPNPVHDKLFVKDLDKLSNITVVNILGQTILLKQSKRNQGYLDVSQLANGIYFLKGEGKQGFFTAKFIKN